MNTLDTLKQLRSTLSAVTGLEDDDDEYIADARKAVDQLIEQAEQAQPVAWATMLGEYAHIQWGSKRPEYPMVYEVPLYTAPPPRQPLTDEEIMEVAKNPMTTPCSPWWLNDEVLVGDVRNAALVFARAIEAAHGIKENT